MSDKFKPNCMEKWKASPNYVGEDLSDEYIIYSRHRDSELVTKSNFETFKKRYADKEGVTLGSFGHWAVGWVEALFVNENADEELLMEIDQDVCYIKEEYPLLDEADWSQREYEQSLENIKYGAKVNDTQAVDIFDWLSKNDSKQLDGLDGRGAWPSDESIERAKKSLGIGD